MLAEGCQGHIPESKLEAQYYCILDSCNKIIPHTNTSASRECHLIFACPNARVRFCQAGTPRFSREEVLRRWGKNRV